MRVSCSHGVHGVLMRRAKMVAEVATADDDVRVSADDLVLIRNDPVLGKRSLRQVGEDVDTPGDFDQL